MRTTRSGSRLRALGFIFLGASISLACTSDERLDGDAVESQAPPSARVEDPQSPVLGVEGVGLTARDVSYVQLWNRQETPTAQAGMAVIVPVEIADAQGDEVGFLSTCFPAELCSPEPYLEEGECVQLENGGEDCLISSNSGRQHIIHIMQGPVSVAEAIAAANLAEGQ